MKKSIFAYLMSALLLYSCSGEDKKSENSSVTEQPEIKISVEMPSESESEFITEGTVVHEEHTESETAAESESDILTESEKLTEAASESSEVSEAAEEKSDNSNNDAPSEDDKINPPAASGSIKTTCSSPRITEKCEWAIAEYFRALGSCDSKKYTSYLPPVYKEYFLEYLSEENYTVDSILKKNYETISENYGGAFSYSALKIDELTESKRSSLNLPDYAADYLEQLDEISQEKYGYDISEKFTECFSVICSADITIASSGRTEKIEGIIITVFEYENSWYIIMA